MSSSAYILFYFFLISIALENVQSENKICGTVSTSEGTTLTLREGVTETPEEFKSVHLGKLKNAVFSPVPGCAIKVCGYNWTDKPSHDWKSKKARFFADCKVIQYGDKANISNIFKLEYTRYSCTCSNLRHTGTSTTSSTTISPTNSFNSTAIKTSKHSAQMDGWCGFIKPRMSSAIILYENTIVDKNELAKIQFNGAVKNGIFSSKVNCTLEICGYSRSAKDPYDKGTCEGYKDDDVITASPDIYDINYEATSFGCACRTEENANYCSSRFGTVDYCISINDEHFWNDLECAIMFQEINCQSCYFKPTSLFFGTHFQSLNSFQMKSMIVRPGCTVDKQMNGNLWIDEELTLQLEGIVSKMDPAYHKDSENFTCNCSPEVFGITHTFLSGFQYVMIVGGLVIMAVITVTVIIIRRHRKRRKFSSITEITDMGSEDNEKVTNSGNYYPETFPRNALKLEDSQVVVSNENSLSRRADHQCLSLGSESYLSNYQSENYTEKQEDKSTENQLKAEIMDEVKLLMESFLVRSAYNDEIHILVDTVQARPVASDTSPPNFNLIKQQFNQVCYPSNIIPRETFMVPETEFRNPLGVGQFGIVYKAVLRQEPDGLFEQVALKKMKWMGSQSFFREIKTFQSIGNGNEHIVQFLGACCHTDGLFLLTELCEGGSLRDHVIEKMRPKVFEQSGPFPETNVSLGDNYYGTNTENEKWLVDNKPALSSSDLHQLLSWSEQIANGMEFLISNRTIHHDLALRNILLTKDLKVKICDFGLSRKCLNTEDCARSLMTGDFPFSSFAPEFVNETVNEPRQVSLYVDVWAYGCILYELFTLGDSLYQDVKEHGIQKFVTIRKMLLEGYRHPKPPLAPDSVYLKMMSCWNEVPKNRPSFTELCSFFEMEKSKESNYTQC